MKYIVMLSSFKKGELTIEYAKIHYDAVSARDDYNRLDDKLIEIIDDLKKDNETDFHYSNNEIRIEHSNTMFVNEIDDVIIYTIEIKKGE